MNNWFVVHTQARQEFIAQRHLQQQGLVAYVPRYRKIVRHARKESVILAPLFPRYIFVAMDLESACWRSINGTRGVAYLLMNSESPAVVPEIVITSLQQQEDTNGLVPVACTDIFARGDKVRVLDGTFKDYVATFEAMDEKQRVKVLLSLLGREAVISLPIYAVEAA